MKGSDETSTGLEQSQGTYMGREEVETYTVSEKDLLGRTTSRVLTERYINENKTLFPRKGGGLPLNDRTIGNRGLWTV